MAVKLFREIVSDFMNQLQHTDITVHHKCNVPKNSLKNSLVQHSIFCQNDSVLQMHALISVSSSNNSY